MSNEGYKWIVMLGETSICGVGWFFCDNLVGWNLLFDKLVLVHYGSKVISE